MRTGLQNSCNNFLRNNFRNSFSNSGYSLIEVLIAIFILGIGVLGAAALQLNAMKYNQTADTRSQATYLAYEIVDKMRANRQAARAGGYNIALSAANPTAVNTLVATDLFNWRTDLSRRLPDGKGGIVQSGNDIFTITVQWDESRLDKTGATKLSQFVFVTEL